MIKVPRQGRRTEVRQVKAASGVCCARSPSQLQSIWSTTWRKPTLYPLGWTPPPLPPPPPPPHPQGISLSVLPLRRLATRQLKCPGYVLHQGVTACEVQSTGPTPCFTESLAIARVVTSVAQTLPCLPHCTAYLHLHLVFVPWSAL